MYHRLVAIVWLVLAWCLPVTAAEPGSSKPEPNAGRIVVAVAGFVGDDTRLRNAITQTFTVSLAQSKRLRLVERERLAKILEEQKLENSGLVDPEQAARIGKLLGASKLVAGGVTRLGSLVSIDARLIDVETGKVEDGGAEQVFGRIQGEGEEVHALARQLATRFHRAITGEWLPHALLSDRAGLSPGAEIDPLALLERGEGGIRLEVKLDREEGSTYRWGETMHISFRVDAPCHVYLFNVDTARQVTQLYPNEWHRDGKVQANRWYQVPGPGEGWDLVIEGEMGLEEIIAIASSRPLGTAASIATVSKSAAQFTGKTVVPKLRQAPTTWAGARVRFFTTK